MAGPEKIGLVPAVQLVEPSSREGFASHGKNLASIVRHSLSTSSISAVFLLLTFMSQAVVAATFGTNLQLDNYYVALAVASYLGNVISRPFIDPLPGFHAIREEKRRNLVSGVVQFLLALGIISAITLYFFPAWAVRILNPNLPGERIEAILGIAKIMVAFPLCISGIIFTEVFMGMGKSFSIPRLLGLFNPIAVMAALYFAADRWGTACLAGGVIISSLLQAAIGFALVRKEGLPLQWKVNWSEASLREYGRTAAPFFITTILGGLTVFIDRGMALRLGGGSVSTLVYAENLFNSLTMVLLIPFGSVMYPYLAESGTGERFSRMFLSLVRMCLALFIPLAALTALKAPQIVALVFERGMFTASDTILVSQVLMALMIGLPFLAVTFVEGRSILILRKTLLSLAFVPLSLALKYMASSILARHFGIIGVALASSALVALFAIINLWIVFGSSAGFITILGGIAGCFSKLAILIVPAGLAGLLVDTVTEYGGLPKGGIVDTARLAIYAIAFLVTYALLLDRFKVIPEFSIGMVGRFLKLKS